MTDPVVIVGGGQAGVQLCLSLRKGKYDGPIVMYSDEADAPYHRPPLSKTFLLDKIGEDKLPMRPESFYTSKSIDLQLDQAVTSIDPVAKVVSCGDNHQQRYSRLILATGASPRQLPIDGVELGGVHCLRSLNDCRSIKSELAAIDRVVVIGAGFIGLEVAAAARSLGKNVTVFDTDDRVMARAVAPAISSWYQEMHRQSGVDLRLSQAISAIGGESGRVTHVDCDDGPLEAQMVVVGIGVVPNISIAEQAGLHCDNGVVVDEFCRTSDEFIFAAGDCANHPNPFASIERLRLESIQNATDQARVIASNVMASLAGEKALNAYHAVPWFWSDQGEHSLQMAGLSIDADQYVTRGEPSSNSFSIYHFKAEQLLAVDSVNMPRDHMLARKLIEAGVSPAAAQAADVEFDLKTLLPAKR